jgi:hypothetical protein
MRDGAHGELMDADAFGSDRVEHGVANSAVCIMILDREEAPLGCGSAFQ